jgi:(2Fe-2S) ferredoxin
MPWGVLRRPDPEGIWYSAVTPELLERIVVEHLKEGRPVEDAVFHRL